MHASQSFYMNSSQTLLDPNRKRVLDNIATVLQKIDTFNGSDRDALRPLCAKVFPKQKHAGDNVPLDKFVETFNERFLTKFTTHDISEMMAEFGMDSRNGVPAFNFFLAVKATGLPPHSHWTHDREAEINENVKSVKKMHPVSFERMKAEAEASPLTLKSERALKEVVEERLQMYTSTDIDRFRQVFRRLDMKNTDRNEGMSKETFKSHIFSKFGFTLSSQDVDDIAHKYPLAGGRIDFRRFIYSLLAGSDNIQLPITQVDENYERMCQRKEREKFFDRELNRHTVFTVKDVRKILNQKIGEFSSRDTDQYRQFFKRLSSQTYITKEDLFEKLWTIFHLNISDSLADKVFHTIDLNGDGYMELSEFVAFLKNENRVSTDNIFGSTRNLDPTGGVMSSSSREMQDTWSAGTLLRNSGNGRRRTSVTTPHTHTDRGVSIENLLKGVYNPSLSDGPRMHSSCGTRLVCTPPPQSAGVSRVPSRVGMGGMGSRSRLSSRLSSSPQFGNRPETQIPEGRPFAVSRPPTSPSRPMTGVPRSPMRTRSGSRLLPDLRRSHSAGSEGSQMEQIFPDSGKDHHYASYASPVPVSVSPIRQQRKSVMSSRMSSRKPSTAGIANRMRVQTPMKFSKNARLNTSGGSRNNLVPSPPPRAPPRPSTGSGMKKSQAGSASFFRRNPNIAKTLGNSTSFKTMTPMRLMEEEMAALGPHS